jgi:hypothetical protein
MPAIVIAPAPPVSPACFGLLCARRGGCARYAAVDFSAADPATLVTCRHGDRLPMFVAIVRQPVPVPA